ncbi:membrane protein FxsA [Shinella daejeonensis]|uniref:FxsA family protein n=1 Tax=Shinella daejeonensis TaxID=659017 RepID=UPI0020C752B9|nr:FxsA family protein [Shinella daejeonensis]MCP8895844.1 membrane protein FxsA [Shinella daejeonensis]
MTRLLPLFVLLLPLAEIAGFIVVGQHIGLWPTLSLVILSAVAGVVVMRAQGFGALARLRKTAGEGVLPGKELLDTAAIVLGGLLLFIPGFLTDLAGIALFFPPVRHWLWNRLRRSIVVVDISGGRDPRRDGRDATRTIDLDSDDFHRDDRP